MPDVARLISTVLTQLADNTSGLITPQVVRDQVLSVIVDFGMSWSQTSRVVNVSNTTNWFGVDLTSQALMGSSRNFSIGSSGLLTYTGTPKRNVFLLGLLNIKDTDPDRNLQARFRKTTSTGITGSEVEFQNNSPTTNYNGQQIICMAMLDLLTDEYVGMDVRSADQVGNLSIRRQQIMALALPATS